MKLELSRSRLSAFTFCWSRCVWWKFNSLRKLSIISCSKAIWWKSGYFGLFPREVTIISEGFLNWPLVSIVCPMGESYFSHKFLLACLEMMMVLLSLWEEFINLVTTQPQLSLPSLCYVLKKGFRFWKLESYFFTVSKLILVTMSHQWTAHTRYICRLKRAEIWHQKSIDSTHIFHPPSPASYDNHETTS